MNPYIPVPLSIMGYGNFFSCGHEYNVAGKVELSLAKHKSYHQANHNSNRKTDTPKIVSKRYHVTTQTAYHLMEIALQEGTTEGRVIDKLMRTYLASRSNY